MRSSEDNSFVLSGSEDRKWELSPPDPYNPMNVNRGLFVSQFSFGSDESLRDS
jgi:hypothetical protein